MNIFREYGRFLLSALPWLLVLAVGIVTAASAVLSFLIPLGLASSGYAGGGWFLLLIIPFLLVTLFLCMLWFKIMEWVDTRNGLQ